MTYEEALKIAKDYAGLMEWLEERYEVLKILLEKFPSYETINFYEIDNINCEYNPSKVWIKHYIYPEMRKNLPLEYFFLSKKELNKLAEEERRKFAEEAEREAEQREREKEARQRALYEKLKQKFEGGK